MPTIDPFSVDGAKRVAQLAGQQLAPQTTPISVESFNTPSQITVPRLPQAPLPNVSVASVSSYADNPDGTTTNYLSDGSQSTVTYTRNADGSLTPNEVPANRSLFMGDTPEQTALREQRTSLVGDITATGEKLATKTSRKAALETEAGVPVLNKQLNELNQQIRSIQAESLAATQRAEDRPMSLGLIRGEQAAVERQRAVKTYGLAAAAEAIQGNIALANDNVARSLDAEFGGLEQEIENKKFLLSVNMDNFNAEEKRRAEKQQIALDAQKEALTQVRADKATILQTMLTAAQSGADNTTLQNIQNAKTPQEAVTIAGKVLGAQFADQKKQQAFENNIKLAQLAIDERKARNESAAAVDPISILAYAQQYASTGTIPTGIPNGTFGLISQVAKELPKPDGSIIDVNTGTKPAIADEKIDGFAALYDITKKTAELKELDKSRVKGLVGAGVAKVLGFDTEQKYADLRTEIIDLLSRARTGAALTQSEEAFYKSQLPGRVSNIAFLGPNSQDRIDNFSEKIEGTLETKLKANQASLVGFSKVKIGGQNFVVGQTVTNSQGQQGRINADGSITIIQ